MRQYTYRQAADILQQLAAALAGLHGRVPLTLHRDVKPDNVLLDLTPPAAGACGPAAAQWAVTAKLCDFGLAVVGGVGGGGGGCGGATTAMAAREKGRAYVCGAGTTL